MRTTSNSTTHHHHSNIPFVLFFMLTVLSLISQRSNAFLLTRNPRQPALVVRLNSRGMSKATNTARYTTSSRTASGAGGSTTSSSDNNNDTKQKLMHDMLCRIRQCNDMPEEIRSSCYEFQVDGKVLGKVRPTMAKTLCQASNGIFEIHHEHHEKILTLSKEHAGTTVESRTKAVAQVTAQLKQDGVVRGWRDELFPVGVDFYSDPVFLMERAAVNVLGILEYGVHINGLVKQDDDQEGNNHPLMWMGRRSREKSKYPGMLDHIVAGGQPAGMSLLDNVIKECQEEAGIPEDITRAGLQPVGAISYEFWDRRTDKITRCVLFNYDLILPSDFVPKPHDGEVEEFFLWNMDQVQQSMALDYPDPIKPNCYIVIIDYLLRTGILSPETPGYLDVLRELRSGDCR